MHHHFLIHKPYGYLSQFIYQLKRKKKLLGELYDFPENTMAIGRLDEDSEGLLLLTTDGMMSEIVRSKKVEKEYYAQVDGIITEEAVEQFPDLRPGDQIAGLPVLERGGEVCAFHREIDAVDLAQPIAERCDHVQQHLVAIGDQQRLHASNSLRAATRAAGAMSSPSAQASRSGS